jgi:hypothetical protein
MTQLFDDPEPPYPPSRPGYRWCRTELGWGTEPIPRSKGQTPHAKLRADGLIEASKLFKRLGLAFEHLPYKTSEVWYGSGKVKTRGFVGKKGAADDLYAFCGTTLAAEAKAGDDTVKANQTEFGLRWTKTGNPHCVYRTPEQLCDAISQVAAQRGKGPFG